MGGRPLFAPARREIAAAGWGWNRHVPFYRIVLIFSRLPAGEERDFPRGEGIIAMFR